MATSDWQWREGLGIRWIQWQRAGVAAAFATRVGGCSQGPYASLNLGLTVGDRVADVIANRRLLGDAIERDPRGTVFAAQVHGTDCRWVGEDDAGRGAESQAEAIAACDGLLTATPSISLAVVHADCVPLVIVAETERGPAFAVVHAGWRGALGGIAARAAAELGRRGRLAAAVIGPSIGPCCFTTDEQLRERFAARNPASVTPVGVDLWRVVADDLLAAGLTAAAIDRVGGCTSCSPDHFSHRRDDGLTGRHMVVAWRANSEKGER